MDFFSKALSPLQAGILKALGKDGPFYLSGGTALSAGYLGHRRSVDIDLFVVHGPDVEDVLARIRLAARAENWQVEVITSYPAFRRLVVRDGDGATLVDIVHEMVPQEVPFEQKPVVNDVRIDAISDLVSNKLCTVLGRGEVKDLVDLYFIARSGFDVLSWLPAAVRKDSGMEPAILAKILAGIDVRLDGLELLITPSIQDVEAYRDALVDSLLRLAWPV